MILLSPPPLRLQVSHPECGSRSYFCFCLYVCPCFCFCFAVVVLFDVRCLDSFVMLSRTSCIPDVVLIPPVELTAAFD